MNREEKIPKIEKMFHDNIPTIKKIRKRPEHASLLFCLFIDDKIIGVNIQYSFMDSKTFPEIESHFSDRHIYHSILSAKACDHDGVFVHGDDPICREEFLATPIDEFR